MEQKATVQITQAMILGCKHPKDIADLPAVADNWIKTYNRCNRRNDGETKYEREKIMFIQITTASAALTKATPFSLYAALMRLAVCGISLEDGEASLIPRGKNCTLHIEAKGRRTMISNLPGVLHVSEPQLVYDCDCDIAFTELPYRPIRNMSGLVINEWQQATTRPDGAQLRYVYVIVQFRLGPKAYEMDRDDVLQIRDEFSDSYKAYIKDMADNAASQLTDKPWPAMKALRNGYEGLYFADIKPPMWVNREGEAWKKTMIHRLWKSMDKQAHQQYLDDRFAAEAAAEGIVTNEFGDDPADFFEFGQDFNSLVTGKQTAGRKPRPVAEAPAAQITQPAAQVAQPQPQPPAPPAPPAPAPPPPPPGPPPQQVWNADKGVWEQVAEAPATPPPPGPPPTAAQAAQTAAIEVPPYIGEDIGDPNASF